MHVKKRLVDLLDGWTSGRAVSSSTREATRHSTRHSLWHSSSTTLIQFGDDGVADLFQFLLLVFILVFFGRLEDNPKSFLRRNSKMGGGEQ